jgi:type II secretory pathway component GspD/PulD (secretin)
MGYRTALPMLLGLALLGTGCVHTTTTQADGAVLPVVSTDPARDGSALSEGNRQLNEVRWQVIEHKGPKTAAEQFRLDKPKDASASGTQHPATNGRSSTSPTVQGHVRVSYPTGAATSQPTGHPTTQATSTVDLPIFSPDGLPVEIVPLMDGRVRIIWTLRNYGGTSVTSNRDPVTSRRTVAIAPPDLAPLVTVLQQQIGPAGNVTPLPRENTIIVTCDRVMESPVLDLLSKLDVAPRQVEIAARIFEVSRDFNLEQGSRVLLKHVGHDNSQTGISLFDAKKGIDVASAAASAAQATPGVGSVISLMKIFESAGISLDASFQILADEGLIRMVSNPRMTVAAGQTGYLLAGQELPIQTANYINNVFQSTTTYKPVGVQLYITPQAVGPNRIKLHTITIVSAVSGFTPVPTLTGQNAREFLMNPVIDSREAETAVTIENGSTLVISGLRMTRTTTREEKVPGLGDLPLLGWMFKNHRSQQSLTDLYFFVTPTLLDAEAAAPSPEAHSAARAEAKHRES